MSRSPSGVTPIVARNGRFATCPSRIFATIASMNAVA